MKKFVCRMTAIMLCCTLLLAAAGCSKAEEKKAEKTDPAAAAQEAEKVLDIKWAGAPISGMYPEDDCFVAQDINKRFNVKIKVVRADSAKNDEMNLLFASGDIPDHFLVNTDSVDKVVAEGLARTIPIEMLKEVAPNLYKSTLNNYPYFEKMKIYNGGKIQAIPQGDRPPYEMAAIRTDWLKKVNAKMPTNLQEFEEVCRLFTQNDPDGNGKNDTYAMGFAGPFFYHVFAAFGVTPYTSAVADDQWLVQQDGTIARVAITEKYKNAIRYIANLFKKGYIHPDVAAKTNVKQELFTNGIVGITTGAFNYLMPKYYPNNAYALAFKNNPNLTTDYLPALKGLNGEEPLFGNTRGAWRYTCIGKDTTDEQLKRIVKILDTQIADMQFHNMIWRGVEGTHFTINEEGMAIAKPEYSSNEKTIEQGFKFFIINNRNTEQQVLSYGKEKSVQAEIQKSWKSLEQPLTPGTIFEKNTEFGADVKKIEEEFFMNAATGSINVDTEWDGYVKRWKAAGGEEILKEANAMYKNVKK